MSGEWVLKRDVNCTSFSESKRTICVGNPFWRVQTTCAFCFLSVFPNVCCLQVANSGRVLLSLISNVEWDEPRTADHLQFNPCAPLACFRCLLTALLAHVFHGMEKYLEFEGARRLCFPDMLVFCVFHLPALNSMQLRFCVVLRKKSLHIGS